jgi:hypothetical protein
LVDAQKETALAPPVAASSRLCAPAGRPQVGDGALIKQQRGRPLQPHFGCSKLELFPVLRRARLAEEVSLESALTFGSQMVELL